jgi:uncharacterized protein (TIGR03435 family)
MKANLSRYLSIASSLVIAVTLIAEAQAPTPSFEVSSIRLESPHSVEELMKGIGLASLNTWPTHRYFAHYITLQVPISLAYHVDPKWITGGPDWLGTQQYSIDATVDGDHELNIDEMRPLLRELLEKRFHLKAHRESRMVSGYRLVLAKNGSKMSPSNEKGQASVFSGGINAPGIDAAALAFILEIPTGEPVVDETGLTGLYGIKLSYAPPNDPNSSLPDIFTAVQEQLGLKLEPAKVPVDYLVIDHVDRVPTQN